MSNLSKSKLMAYRQCPKRLWLEIHKPETGAVSNGSEKRYEIGNQVGDIARKLYDPNNQGERVDIKKIGFDLAFKRTQELMSEVRPIFEAGYSAAGALAFADVMLPIETRSGKKWKMVEVKSSTSVKEYHYDDIAIQTFVARAANVALQNIAVSHIDSSWVYPGEKNYQGLLIENDLTEIALRKSNQVKEWIDEAQLIASDNVEPDICTGSQCYSPYECGFIEYCKSKEPQAEIPYSWLPRLQKNSLKEYIQENDIVEMKDIPDEMLNEKQLLVKQHTLSNKVYFDKKAALSRLGNYGLPAYFLDFETIQFAVPIWPGTRPYQMIPFQFSFHWINSDNQLNDTGFLDLSGNNPSRAFAEKLIEVCGETGPVYVYNAGFEKTRIKELADSYPALKKPLLGINNRIVDLLPVTRECYYHPAQKGSWSIKAVLPTIAPELDYQNLEGVQDGTGAMGAYLEAISPETSPTRKLEIEQQLLAYCGQDTLAMVKLWEFFTK